ncbi:hypothetical protein JCM8208_001760 [Rhodotorula glutinis]
MAASKHTLPFVTVDAFTTRPFSGNPASVLVFPLGDDKLQQLARDDTLMQQVAAEFNLSETAYCRELEGGTEDEPRYELRWRTPVAEVPLCGHATLASAYALFSQHHPSASTIRFDTRQSGTLFARRTRPSSSSSSSTSASSSSDDVGLISLDFPMASILALSDGHRRLPKIIAAIEAATGLSPDKVVRCAWYDAWEAPLVELSSDVDLEALEVKAQALSAAGKLVILTQPAPDGAAGAADIHSRVFGAPLGIDEDPVTGAAHTALAPFWLASGPEALSRVPGASEGTLRARQVSRRGGEMVVVLDEEKKRVELRGSAVRVMRGEIEL